MYYREAGLQETEDWLFLLPGNYKRLIENWARQHFVIEKVITSCQGSFSFVPIQDFTHEWDDGTLYDKYGLTETEIKTIESIIKPME